VIFKISIKVEVGKKKTFLSNLKLPYPRRTYALIKSSESKNYKRNLVTDFRKYVFHIFQLCTDYNSSTQYLQYFTTSNSFRY